MACLLIHGSIQTSKAATQTQTRRHSNDNIAAVNENKGSAWRPFTELLASVGELAEMYFPSPGLIASMDADHRANLTARRKTDSDADLMGLR